MGWAYENVRPKARDVVLRVFQEYVSVHPAPFSGLWSRELRFESSPGSQPFRINKFLAKLDRRTDHRYMIGHVGP